MWHPCIKKVADMIKVIVGLLAFCLTYQKSLKDGYTSKFLIFWYHSVKILMQTYVTFLLPRAIMAYLTTQMIIHQMCLVEISKR